MDSIVFSIVSGAVGALLGFGLKEAASTIVFQPLAKYWQVRGRVISLLLTDDVTLRHAIHLKTHKIGQQEFLDRVSHIRAEIRAVRSDAHSLIGMYSWASRLVGINQEVLKVIASASESLEFVLDLGLGTKDDKAPGDIADALHVIRKDLESAMKMNLEAKVLIPCVPVRSGRPDYESKSLPSDSFRPGKDMDEYLSQLQSGPKTPTSEPAREKTQRGKGKTS